MRHTLPLAFGLVLSLSLAADAQGGSNPPSGQFGIGLYVNSGGNSSMLDPGGVNFEYAIDANIHIGTTFALQVLSGGGNAYFGFGPYFRYQIDGPVNPFFDAGFRVISAGGTGFGLNFGGGLAYYLGRQFGVYVAADVLGILLSPGTGVSFAFGNTHGGVNYFFGR